MSEVSDSNQHKGPVENNKPTVRPITDFKQPLLVDFEHENEPDISLQLVPSLASISEEWGQYPHKPVCQISWDNSIKEAIENIVDINPYVIHKKAGEEISAIEAINWIKGQYGQVDFRPKIYDNITKSYTLCDTGAMISCVPKEPGDKLDPIHTIP